MTKPKTADLPLLLFPSKQAGTQAWMTQLKKKKLIRAAGPRLYTSVSQNQIKETIRGQWAEVVSQLFPTALLSHRSALDYRPNESGEIFLTSSTNRIVKYPGLTLRFLRGPSALKDDSAFLNLKASSLPRALLENLTGKGSKVVGAEEIEKRLEQILLQNGEAKLNEIRDRAREISKTFKWKKEFDRLNSIIGGLLGTNSTVKLKSAQAKSRSQGLPFDPHCFEKLEILYGELRHYPLSEFKEKETSKDHLTNKAFFEAYFSNYIEGTTFEIEEAESIIFEGKIPEKRPKDARDILGTYRIVCDPNVMKKTPRNSDEFENILKHHHALLMNGRPEVNPGEFKDKPNRAGNTHFVHPDYVKGSLAKGYEFYKTLPPGLSRAIFIMFLVAEVHPFMDGNGRIARVLMNAELFSEGLSTIIVPNVYREDYLSALRALSRRERAKPLIDMLAKAHKFSHLKFSPYPRILKYLQSHNWFEESNDGELIF